MIIEGTLYYIRPEKIKIGDKKFRSIRHEILETLEENIKKRGLRGPFIVTRIGNELVTYTDFNRLIAAKEMGKELVPCVIISNELMNKRINRLNRYRRDNKITGGNTQWDLWMN